MEQGTEHIIIPSIFINFHSKFRSIGSSFLVIILVLSYIILVVNVNCVL